MNKFKFAFQAFALVGLFFAFSTLANAQATRTWVSGVGDDVNPCSRTAPCKTFAGAISKTAANGEINCLDSGGFGTITITKSITIDCTSTMGSILAALAPAGVNINGSGINVRLRGLSINGVGTGTNGIRVLNTGSVRLTIENVLIDGFTTHGVSVETNTGASTIVINNSSIRNNGGNGINTFLGAGGSTEVSVEKSLIAFNNIGVNIGAATNASIHNSSVTNNTTGLQASGSTAVMAAKDNQITQNGTGVLASSSSTIRIGSNVISGNGTGLSGSNIFTWGSNFVDGNTVNGTPTGGAILQ